MRFKKTVAAGLAAIMLAGQAVSPLMSAFAADGDEYDVYVTFANSDDPRTNSIVTGGAVDVNVRKPNGYIQKNDSNNGLKITGVDYGNPNAQGINVTGDTVKSINITDKFSIAGFTPGEAGEAGRVNLSISGAYDAILKEGSVVEKGWETYWEVDADNNPIELKQRFMSPINSKFTVSELTVFETSTITIECSKTETANEGPSFDVIKDDTRTNVFKDYEIATVEGVRQSDTDSISVTLTGAPGTDVRPCTITFTPYSYYTLDAKGQPLKNAEDADQGNRYIQKGSKFTFTVNKSRSNDIILSVYTPQAAAADIKQDIERQTGEDQSGPFIRLAEGDTLTFIRNNFQVEYSTRRYNTDFYLEWYWKPKGTRQDDSDHKVEYSDEQLQGAVIFASQPNGWQTVTINPLYHDLDGELRAKIRCRTSDKTVDPVGEEVAIPVIIKGTGEPASLKPIKQWITEEDPNDSSVRTVVEKSVNLDNMPERILLNAYDGTVAGTPIPAEPSKYQIQLNMGKDGGASSYAIVECVSGDPNLITMQTQGIESGAALNDYTFGNQIENPRANTPSTEGAVSLIFTPVKTGVRTEQTVTLRATFYVPDSNGQPVKAINQPPDFRITVKDDSPSNDATLRTLVVRGKTEKSSSLLRAFWPEIDIGFDPATTEYNLELPYEYTAIDFTPNRNEPHAKDRIQINIIGIDDDENKKVLNENWKNNKDADGFFLINGRRSPEVPLIENKLVQVEIVVTAEDTSTQTYKLNIMRKPMGVDATLKSLTMTDPEGNVLFNGIQQNVFEYTVEIPFKVQRAEIAYELTDPNAQRDKTEFTPALEKNGIFTEAVWLNIIEGCKAYDAAHPDEPATTRKMDFHIKTLAEDGVSSTEYTIHIHRADPSEVNTLQSLEVLDGKNDDAVIEYKPAFHKDMDQGDYYDVEIPYSASRIKIRAQADDSGSTVILRDIPRADEERDFVIDGSSMFGKPEDGGKGWVRIPANSPTNAFTPIFFDEDNQEGTYHTFEVEVWPESTFPPVVWERPQGANDPILGEATYTYQEYIQKVVKYPLHIYRAPPSRINTLESIVLADQDGNHIESPELDLDFDPEQNEYTINVPYEVTAVQVTPTATDPLIYKLTVNDKKIDNGTTSSPVKLTDYKESPRTEIKIEVYPESYLEPEKFPDDQEPNVYTLTIVRGAPSTDALLIKLETQNTTDFKPVFAPMRTDYSANVAEGAEGVIIIPTANHPGAKIEVDGKRVESGQPSELIHIITVRQTVKIVVTAQDGETKKEYNIRFTNPNLINKTSNADLSSLDIEPGVRRPIEFDPSVTEYDISVDEETYAVKLFPTPADSMAEMKVFRGSQEIGDEDGNYASSIQDGENKFTIEVTAPDESKKKTYTVTIYRNDEENMGRLTPLHAEDIDYENAPDVIIVDVTKYPRIHRDVFEELKNYPDKKIIFQGNDYSLQFDASDIDKVIPSTEIYTFGMSFRSPLEVEISDEIYSHAGNSDANLVFVYFDHHGQLPGPAVLTLSLGSKYRNSNFYWNYYNEERQRVDYYGTVNTNSKGTFSLIIDHLSTYIISDQKLIGANDVSTDTVIETLSPYNDKDLGAEAIDKKLIPNTGASAD